MKHNKFQETSPHRWWIMISGPERMAKLASMAMSTRAPSCLQVYLPYFVEVEQKFHSS